jgi:hypothetical protein
MHTLFVSGRASEIVDDLKFLAVIGSPPQPMANKQHFLSFKEYSHSQPLARMMGRMMGLAFGNKKNR